MQFINDNLIWLIIIAVVIILAIIGFIAEKSGFGIDNKKNDKKDDVTPVENEVPETVEPTLEEIPNELSFDETSDNQDSIEETGIEEEAPIDISSQLDSMEDFNLDEPSEEINEEANDTSIEPIENEEMIEEPEEIVSEEELKNEEPEEISFEEEPRNEEPEEISFEEEPKNEEPEEITFEEEPKNEESSQSINNDEDLYAPFGDQEFNKENNLNIDEDFNEVLKDIDKTVEKVDTNSSSDSIINDDDDDIWKF